MKDVRRRKDNFRQREYNSYWLQCIQNCTANLKPESPIRVWALHLVSLKSPGLDVGYYSQIPETMLPKRVTLTDSEVEEASVENGWSVPPLLGLLRVQEGDIALERNELNYLATQLVENVERYNYLESGLAGVYLDQDSKITQDLRWVLSVAKEKERLNTRRHEILAFRATLTELCEELSFCEYTLKVWS